MIDLLFLLRFFADFFWEYKILNIFFVFVCAFLAILRNVGRTVFFRVTASDVILLLFIGYISILEIIYCIYPSSIEYAKFVAFFILYFAGRLGPVRFSFPMLTASLAFLLISIFFLLSFFGVAYQEWGNVYTFTGGYYFKTDLTLSVLILFSLICSLVRAKTVMVIVFLMVGFVVVKSNARIALPLVFVLPLMSFFLRRGSVNFSKISAILLLTVSFGGVVFYMIDFNSMGLLGFDFADPFSRSNTQGRSVIWLALLEGYLFYDIQSMLFGHGLGGDVALTRLFSEASRFAGVRAHNSYIYLLICTGLFGFIIFWVFIFQIIGHMFNVLFYRDDLSVFLALLFVIFFWLSLTTEIIIRPQLMALIFYFSGIVVQISVFRAYTYNSTLGLINCCHFFKRRQA